MTRKICKCGGERFTLCSAGDESAYVCDECGAIENFVEVEDEFEIVTEDEGAEI